jgi:twitching motility protein PilT
MRRVLFDWIGPMKCQHRSRSLQALIFSSHGYHRAAGLQRQAGRIGSAPVRGLPPMIRVDGDMRRINLPPLEHKQVHDLIYDIMNDKQRKDFEEFLETDFSFEVPGVARFRVNAFNQKRGAGGVFRTIPSKVLTMEDLGMGQVFRDIADAARPGAGDRAHGLRQVDDPGGDDRLHQRQSYQHILTIEDPIEFVHDSKQVPGQPARGAPGHARLCEALRSACARTRTSSWSARCVTSRPSAWR